MTKLRELETRYQSVLNILKGRGKELLEYATICNLTEVLEHHHGLSETTLNAVRIAEDIVREKKLTGEEKFNLLFEPFGIENEYRGKIVQELRRECECKRLD